jgi:hypothetical protein
MVHIGASGYYKVIMAHLVFSTDKVLLSNTDRGCPLGLDSRARRWRRAVISSPADLMYVNAGVTHPPSNWRDTSRRVTRGRDLRSYCHISHFAALV